MSDAYFAIPKPPPALQIPDSSSTVDVRVIDTYVAPYLMVRTRCPGLTQFSMLYIAVIH